MPRPKHLKKPGRYEGKEYADIYPKILSSKHYILIGERKKGRGKRGGRTERLGDLRPRKGYTEVNEYRRKDGTKVRSHARGLRPVSIPEANKIMNKRSRRSVSMDRRRTSKQVYKPGSKKSSYWRKNYRKTDLQNVDTKK